MAITPGGEGDGSGLLLRAAASVDSIFPGEDFLYAFQRLTAHGPYGEGAFDVRLADEVFDDVTARCFGKLAHNIVILLFSAYTISRWRYLALKSRVPLK